MMNECITSRVLDYTRKGTILWRPLQVDHNKRLLMRLAPVAPKIESGRHDMVKVLIDGYGQNICEPVVNPVPLDKQRAYGICTFLRGTMPECWTHLVVTNKGKNNNCLFAVPECLELADYYAFRLQCQSFYVQCESLARLALLTASVVPAGLPDWAHRIQVFQSENGYYVQDESVTTTADCNRASGQGSA